MKKQVLLTAAVLLASSVTFAQAGEALDAGNSAQAFINGYLGKTQAHVNVASNEAPNADKSLAIGISSILGTGKRFSTSVGNDTPDLTKSLARFTNQYKS